METASRTISKKCSVMERQRYSEPKRPSHVLMLQFSLENFLILIFITLTICFDFVADLNFPRFFQQKTETLRNLRVWPVHVDFFGRACPYRDKHRGSAITYQPTRGQYSEKTTFDWFTASKRKFEK